MFEHTNSDNLYQSLLEMNNLLVREVTPNGLFACLSRYFQEYFQCDRVSLSIYDKETDSLAWFATARGMSLTEFDTENTPLRGPLARMAIETKQTIFEPDLTKYAHEPGIRYMLHAGLRSSIAFPLANRGLIIGALVISFTRHLTEADQKFITILEKMSPQVALAVDNMLIHSKLNQQNELLHQQVESLLQADTFDHAGTHFFYSCATMQNIMKQLRTLAKSDVPVLICGETGTGKEFLARYIHNKSPRAGFNFVKVSCPALSPSLFESELFGHAKGAFTGAASRRLGRFELADKGSIFLDEIGELNLILQAKLLHVLQDATFERVGESNPINVDARCISATNADLQSMMREGTFRRDLFYRMGVTTIQVPALRDREGEIAPMLDYLINLHSAEMHTPKSTIHPDTMKVFLSYSWPGNVRELSNLVRRMLVLHAGDVIGPEHVTPLLETNNFTEPQKKLGDMSGFGEDKFFYSKSQERNDTYGSSMALSDMEKLHIEEVLRKTCGRISGPLGAAKILNVPRSTLQYKLKKFNINPHDFKT